ncbi:FtsK/SpoIIIE domain-containing protein [Nocardioides caldifontis]|uniref:FtsK/SpoIIIE domain-containing protein n=1 Tax=Nocardioides caldifontis TaxID=2588938 RepID=UPI001EF129DD|nr:FtsK/SpoIIIE domain-containing protein [Nocardioides caldifontis]
MLALASFLAREVRWWVRHILYFVRRALGLVLIAAALIWWFGDRVPSYILVALAFTAATIRGWALLASSNWRARIEWPARGVLSRLAFRWRWPTMAEACGLTQRDEVGDIVAPALRTVTCRWPWLRCEVKTLPGQKMGDFEAASEALRHALGALHLRVEQVAAAGVLLTFTMDDTLASPFATPEPGIEAAALEVVEVGRTEAGKPWNLPLGPHTLVAGCSGSGKGSVLWSFVLGLAPASHTGLVRLHGIDLKGGMELLMGARLFATTATTAAEAVALLEELVEQMRKRTRRYAGHVRFHEPTVEDPFHVVVIDELAALTAYCTERDLLRRAELAINLLCSQGRAPGFMVFACLQDPRKEVIPSRGLFTQMVGLRLKDVNETAMVLGETAVTAGVHCHRIRRDAPGTGYVVPEDGGPPLRVRAGFASDEVVRAVADRFPAPPHEQVVEEPA